MKEIDGNELDGIVDNGLVVVDFYADWCAPCRFLKPILEKVEREFEGITFVKVNIEEHPEIAFKYGITSIPTVLIFRNGKVVGGFVGVLPEDAIKAEILKAQATIR